MTPPNAKIFFDTFIFLELFEKCLNIAGYIPVIGSVSATIRNNYAKIELVAGIAFTILAVVFHVQQNQYSAFYLSVGATFVGHALLNELRSYIEVVPFLHL